MLFMRTANQEPAVRLPLSFEFFPTKTPEGAVKLRAVRQQLYAQLDRALGRLGREELKAQRKAHGRLLVGRPHEQHG